MPRLHARRVLAEAAAGRLVLTGKGWFDFTLAATGDVEEADAARATYAQREMDARRTPE